jgi:taurine dioxygenase
MITATEAAWQPAADSRSTETIVPMNAPMGAQIHGVDIATGIDSAQLQRIKDALHKYKAIVLRDQKITPDQQIAFCGRIGTLEPHILPQYLVPGHKQLVRISNVLDIAGQPIGMIDAGRIWHSDGQFQELPNMYSMLYALEIPHDDAGQPLGATQFVSTAVAYAQLPEATRTKIDGLQAVHSLAAVYAHLRQVKPDTLRAPLTEKQKKEVVHPLVRTHPVTGEKCLYVSRAATLRILGLPEQESAALIDELSAWILREGMVFTHRWQVGDLLMWDNCASQHFAIGDYALPQRRMMHRASVGGSKPF